MKKKWAGFLPGSDRIFWSWFFTLVVFINLALYFKIILCFMAFVLEPQINEGCWKILLMILLCAIKHPIIQLIMLGHLTCKLSLLFRVLKLYFSFFMHLVSKNFSFPQTLLIILIYCDNTCIKILVFYVCWKKFQTFF